MFKFKYNTEDKPICRCSRCDREFTGYLTDSRWSLFKDDDGNKANFSDLKVKDVDGESQVICSECDYDLVWCEGCETFHWDAEVSMSEKTFYDDDEWVRIYVCDDWAYNHLYYCEHCDNYFTSYSWDDDLDMCCECAEEYRATGGGLIEGYHDSSDWKEFVVGDIDDVANPLFGFELEVDTDLYDTENKFAAARAVKERLGEHVKLENDCSLDRAGAYSGFEIVSQPHTWEAFLEIEDELKWALLNDLVDYDFMSHDAETCGLHIHINRKAFGWSREEQEENIAKALLVYENFYSFFLKASRRTLSQADRWAGKYCETLSFDNAVEYDIAKDRCKRVASNGAGRYYAVNCRNANTIEFRLGRGTLIYETLRAWIDLHLTIVRNIKNDREIDWERKLTADVMYKLLQGVEQNTFRYLSGRRCFGTLDGGGVVITRRDGE